MFSCKINPTLNGILAFPNLVKETYNVGIYNRIIGVPHYDSKKENETEERRKLATQISVFLDIEATTEGAVSK